MTTYRAKLIIERVEMRRPMIRGTEVPKEAVYDEVRIEVTSTDSDVALSKIIGLAQSEQTDRDSRKVGVVAKGLTPAGDFDEDAEDEEED